MQLHTKRNWGQARQKTVFSKRSPCKSTMTPHYIEAAPPYKNVSLGMETAEHSQHYTVASSWTACTLWTHFAWNATKSSFQPKTYKISTSISFNTNFAHQIRTYSPQSPFRNDICSIRNNSQSQTWTNQNLEITNFRHANVAKSINGCNIEHSSGYDIVLIQRNPWHVITQPPSECIHRSVGMYGSKPPRPNRNVQVRAPSEHTHTH